MVSGTGWLNATRRQLRGMLPEIFIEGGGKDQLAMTRRRIMQRKGHEGRAVVGIFVILREGGVEAEAAVINRTAKHKHGIPSFLPCALKPVPDQGGANAGFLDIGVDADGCKRQGAQRCRKAAEQNMAEYFSLLLGDQRQDGIARSVELVGQTSGTVLTESHKVKFANGIAIARGFIANDQSGLCVH
jgi:hypothetical protein